MAAEEKIVNKLTNKLVLSEKLNSVDYHRTFRVLAITALHEIHFVEIIPNVSRKSKPVELKLQKTIESSDSNDKCKDVIDVASHDVKNNKSSTVSNVNENSSSTAVENSCENDDVQSNTTKEKLEPSAKKKKSKSAHYQHQQRQQTESSMNKKVEYDTQPFVLQTVKKIRKVKMPTKIVWYPNPSEMSVAFIQQGGSVMIIFNVLTINEEGKSIVQQRRDVNLEKEHVISVDVDDHNMHYVNTNYNTNNSSISSTTTVHTKNNICNTKTAKEHVSERVTSNNSYLSSSTRSTLKDAKFDSEHRNVHCSMTPTTLTDNTFTSTTDNSSHVNNGDASNENNDDLDDNSICTSHNHKRTSSKELSESVCVGEVNNEDKTKVPVELVNPSTGMSSAQMVKENVKTEVIININTKERTVEKIAWDLHNPFTLAVSSSTTWFELWSFEQNEYGERSKLLTLHPPPSHDQIKVSDLVFSPYNSNLIVVMAYVRNQYSAVIFDRRQLDQPKFIATPYKAITAAFHPLFTDLLAISYYKKSDSKQGQIAFLSITEKTKTAVNETKLKINTQNEHNGKEQSKTSNASNIKQQELLQKKEEEEELRQDCKEESNSDFVKTKTVKDEVNQVGNNNDNNTYSSREFLPESNKCESSNNDDDEESDCNDRCNFIIREDVLPPIDICEMISHLRWRPTSHGEYVQLDTNYKYRTFISHLLEPTNSNTLKKTKEYYSELLSTQLWLGTLANFTYAITDSSTVTDVHINVWDALNAQLPVASIKYLETNAKVPLDFVWINEITLVAILRNGPIIATSLLNSIVNWKAKELFTPNKESITIVPDGMEKIKENMSHDACNTSHSSYSLSWPSPTESTKEHHDHSNSVTPSPNTSPNKLLETNTSEQLKYNVDETVNLSSMHTILPTSAIDCGFFGNVYVIRNSAASLKTHYLSIVHKECNRFIARLTSAIHAEEQFPIKITSEQDREKLMEEKITQQVEPVMETSTIQKNASDNAKERIDNNDNEITHVEPLTGATSSNAATITTASTTTRTTTAVESSNSNNNITTANINARTDENLWWTRVEHFVRSAIGNTSHKPRRPIRKTALKNRNDSTSHSLTATATATIDTPMAITRSVNYHTDTNQRVGVHSLDAQVHSPFTTKYDLQHPTTTTRTLLPPQSEQLHDDCESSEFVNTCSENNNALEDLVLTTPAYRTENNNCNNTNDHHEEHHNLSDNGKHCDHVVKGCPLIKIIRDMCNNNKKLNELNIVNKDEDNDYNNNNEYNVIECTEMQLHLPFVHPCLEIFSVDNNNNNKCGWAYCESLHSSELFAMYALKWEMGYEVAEGLRHLGSIIDKVNKIREENNEFRCSIANQPSHNDIRSSNESPLEQHEENVWCRSPNVTFIPDVYIVDDRFAAMMESNAEICDECNELLYKTHHHNSSSQQTPWWSSFDLTTLERQESSVKEQTLDSDTAGHVCNTSLLSSNNYNNDSLEGKNYNEGNYTDTRAHWWRVMAESLRSHNAHHVYEVTVSQLEYASLIGDVQYCLVLYILYCLWWRIRHMEAVDLSTTRYEEQNDYINTTHIRNNNTNASRTFDKLNNALECPLMPNQRGNNNQLKKSKYNQEEKDGKKHDEYEQEQQHATTTETKCTPDQWKMRALQWLETYSNALRQRKLFVPLNELLLIFPEISHEEKNAVQPKAPEIAYGKRATYIFCGNCNEEIEPELTLTSSLEVPEVIKSFQHNLYEHHYVNVANDNNEAIEEFTPHSLELTEHHHYKRDKDTKHHKINVNRRISVSENTDMYNSHRSYYNDTKHSLKESIVSSSSSTSSSDSLSEEETHKYREHECCFYGNVNASLTETKNERIHHNASCHHCNDATAMKCVICNEVVEGLYYWLCSCGHGGHPYHIQEWLEISNQCPRCGVVITDNTKSNREQKAHASSLSSSSTVSSVSSVSSPFSEL